MTVKEQNQKRIAEIEEHLPTMIEEYNKTLLESGAIKCATLGGEIGKLSNELVKCYKVVAFEDLLATDKPLINAIIKLDIPVKRAKERKPEDMNVKLYSIDDATIRIDIKEFESYAKRQLAVDKDWHHMVAKFNYLLLTYAIENLVKNKEIRESEVAKIRDSYHMKEIARAINLGETPTSNTQMLKQLNTIIAAIIGEEVKIGDKAVKATSHDVFWLQGVYMSKNKKALTAKQATNNQLQGIITEIMHGLLTGREYKVISKYVKQ